MLTFHGAYGRAETVEADIHVYFFPAEEEGFAARLKSVAKPAQGMISALRARGDFTGLAEEEEMLFAGEGRFLAVGLGAKNDLSTETLRRAAARAGKRCAKYAARTAAFHLIDEQLLRRMLHLSFEEQVQAIVEGAALGLYRYDAYQEKKKERVKGNLASIALVTSEEGFQGRLKSAIERAAIVAEAVELARNLSNAPANSLNAEALAKEAVERTKKYGVKAVILRKPEIEAHRMGGLLAVNRGSRNEPRFIVLEYNLGRRKAPCIALVGKGVTFDSGGISIKPSANMAEMKMDMSGAAAVIGVMRAAARLKLPLRLVGLIPATDNMPSGSALCPGDIIRMSNGKTVEVEDTDAEGRLILADALVYAQRYKPDGIVDLATLTGAVVVALGFHVTGMMGTGKDLMERLRRSGARTFERVCELPLYEEYEKQIRSEMADIKNLGGRWGGAITAAMFLKHFIGGFPWVHLDIAGTAMLEEEGFYTIKGGSGVGVRLLVDMLSGFGAAES